MRTPMETVDDLIEEAKVRTVVWAICIFAVSYFLTHTSKSMLINIPMSILIVAFFRYLSFHLELRLKPSLPVQTKRQVSSKPSAKRQPSTGRVQWGSKWRGKVESESVGGAMEAFVDLLLRDFVVDLWYDEITSDREAVEIMRGLLLEMLGEVSARVKAMNLVDLLTRDMVDLIGNQMDLYRKNQTEIGVKKMRTLSSEERDEKLKQHLIASKELHPALFSPQSEHKVLQEIVGGVLGIVLKPQEANCPLVRSICRELLACLVLQPLMNFACPNDINELIELVFLKNKETDKSNNEESNSTKSTKLDASSSSKLEASSSTKPDLQLAKIKHQNTQNAPEWAMNLDAATKRRTQVLEPENLENMWTKGRHYQKKMAKQTDTGTTGTTKELTDNFNERINTIDDKYMVNLMHSNTSIGTGTGIVTGTGIGTGTSDISRSTRVEEKKEQVGSSEIKRSNSSPDLETKFSLKSEKIRVLHGQGSLNVPKIRCRVVGAFFEKTNSKTVAVYSIAVSDAHNKTWFVKRRYRNFERLHRLLKEIPNYSLHLPPKNFLSSSTDDQLVHQRCILLDKYLQDLLSMANLAEQHEVLDFLSDNSKNYSFGKSASVMKTLAVNMDDAMDDIVRQFKGVTDGLARIVTPPSDLPLQDKNRLLTTTTTNNHMALSWAPGPNPVTRFETATRSLSDDESNYGYQDKRAVAVVVNTESGWHSDNETKSDGKGLTGVNRSVSLPDPFQDPNGVPPGWTPPNVSVPLLNLVDNLFQLKRKGWLRRQVLWISKQILQLVMEDAIDDWMVRQIHFLRNPNMVTKGIRLIQDVLWPNGTFFTRVEGYKPKMERSSSQTGRQLGSSDVFHESLSPSLGRRQTGSSSQLFESQFQASKRANDVKKLLLEGTPPTLVSLIGQKSYQRCARDIYFFLQSTVCVKQLAYSMLELVIISVFPELRQLITEIHEKAHDELY